MSESKKLSPHVILEINLKNLKFNYSKIKKKVSKKTTVAATVKSDGYGLGSVYYTHMTLPTKMIV